ncbi:FMN reductase (NADPH) [Xylanibacillus composti]|uniref:FMN reductase (NADPH) n=1 Tax=Xylanibacillus composti TaxID=1572762 RepID=A0A8J4M3I3_9BACL|nr:NADPH-dependent FMN reductase [Xylanibacillus composti]MDT9726988.1 FMN reductase (NADPH) [Xylanibacillus composti]GIQ69546.1 FMN reductase (NADPH) [Xylanibacillus composti]
MAKIVIVSGNPVKHSRLNGLTEHAAGKLQESGYRVAWIHVSDLPAEDLIHAKFDSPSILEANAQIEQADAVILASPVYKASFSGVLKAYLDLLPQQSLHQKLILPLFIGGSIAHLLAVEYSLKPIVSVLGARNQLAGVYAVDSWVTREEQGGFALSEELLARLDDSIRQLTEELRWLSVRREWERNLNSDSVHSAI